MSSRSSGGRPQFDVVFSGTFSAWRLGTLQARAIPLAQEFCRRGVRCAIVTTPWDMPFESGVVDVIDGALLHNTTALGRSLRDTLRAISEQKRIITSLSPRALHVFKPRGFGGFAGMRLWNHLPVVVDSDDWEGDGGWNRLGSYSLLQRRVFDWQERTMLREAAGVTAASSLLLHRARVLRRASDGSTPEPSDVLRLPNALPVAWYRELTSASAPDSATVPTILLYSRFAEFSSDWLPRFATAVDQRLESPVRLRLVGASGVVSGLRYVIMDQMGYVTRSSLPSALGSAAISVVPHDDSLVARSKHSVKLLELMASGCAIIASDVGDTAEIAGPAAVLMSSNDPLAMASAAVALLRSPDTIRRLSESARTRVRESYLVPDAASRLERWYRQFGFVA